MSVALNRFAILGVDPGRRGAISCVSFLGNSMKLEYLKLERLPAEPRLFAAAIKSTIETWTNQGRLTGVALEMPFSLKGQANMISYGRHFGHLELALEMAVNDSLSLYYPQQWQPVVMPRFKEIKAKETASYLFNKLFKLPPKLREHDGVVDATCIALAHAIKLEIIDKNLIDWKQFSKEKGLVNAPRKWTSKKPVDKNSKPQRPVD